MKIEEKLKTKMDDKLLLIKNFLTELTTLINKLEKNQILLMQHQNSLTINKILAITKLLYQDVHKYKALNSTLNNFFNKKEKEYD